MAIDDLFWARALDMTPTQYFDFVLRFMKERFLDAEQRRAAYDQMLKAAAELITEEGGEDDLPVLLSLKDFLDSVGEPPPAIAEGFLPANKLICFSGAAKEGKSLVSLQILEDVASNPTMMGRFPITENGCVAYFGLEDGGHEIKARLTQRGKLDMENYFVCCTPFDMHTPVGWQMFLSMVESMPSAPKLVVIDTAREAYASLRDWNDAAVVGPAFKKLRRWAQKNCTVLLISHTNKDKFATGVNRVSGSTAFVSSMDIVAVLSGQKYINAGDMVWDYEISGRGVKKSKYQLMMQSDTMSVKCLDEEESETAEAAKKLNANKINKKLILEAVEDMEYFNAHSLSTVVEMDKRYIRDMITELRTEGRIRELDKKIKFDGMRNPLSVFVLTSVQTDTSTSDNDDDDECTVLGNRSSSSSSAPQNEFSASASDALNSFFGDDE